MFNSHQFYFLLNQIVICTFVLRQSVILLLNVVMYDLTQLQHVFGICFHISQGLNSIWTKAQFSNNLSLINKSDKLKTIGCNLCWVISALSCAFCCLVMHPSLTLNICTRAITHGSQNSKVLN